MTEDIKSKVAVMLSTVCRGEKRTVLCPFDCTGQECPFAEKDCEEITQDDWIKWME